MKFLAQLTLIAAVAAMQLRNHRGVVKAKHLYKDGEACKEDVLAQWQKSNEDCEEAAKNEGANPWQTKVEKCNEGWTKIIASQDDDKDAINTAYDCRCKRERDPVKARADNQSAIGHFFASTWTHVKNGASGLAEKGCEGKVKAWEGTVRSGTFDALIAAIKSEAEDNIELVYSAMGGELTAAKDQCLQGDGDNTEACQKGATLIANQVKTSCCELTKKCRDGKASLGEKRDCVLATRHCFDEAAQPMEPYVAWFAGHSTAWPEKPKADATLKEKAKGALGNTGAALKGFWSAVKDRALLPDPCADGPALKVETDTEA